MSNPEVGVLAVTFVLHCSPGVEVYSSGNTMGHDHFSPTSLMFLPKQQTCLKRTVFPEATTVLWSSIPWVKWVIQTVKVMPPTCQNGEIPLWEEGQLGAVLPRPWRRWDWIWVLSNWEVGISRVESAGGWGQRADLALRDNHQLSSARNQPDIWKILFKSQTSATRRRKLLSQQQLCQNKEGDVRPQGSPRDLPRTGLSIWNSLTKKQM